ncbi:MAG: hypothetical protein EOO51_03245 [Flavobacterium sp.]|nr:MAG: hypothetical protein EOO51_03245 [Flavobacterium sp.]
MPLTAGFRDEENERIGNTLKKLTSLEYVPEDETYAFDDVLKQIALSVRTLRELTPEDLVVLIQKLHFNWGNAEIFADFLASQSEGIFKMQALAVYRYIQSESKIFSFEINSKIASLTKS